ncbi:MAG TPA: hypothetical protein PKL52_09060 [Tenuifilaceae bacterium]|nr:hypothetical protein [Tenuifilaceae bacterium]
MKRLFLIILIAGVLSCDKQNNCEISACGICNPSKNISWLKEMIDRAEADKSGNYIGTIWLEKSKNDDVFVTNMALGSGGIAYYFFDCGGNPYIPENIEQFTNEMKLNVIIYSNVP